jgi:acetate kinase
MKLLCVNAGSSSLKYQLFEMPEEKVIISGYIENNVAKVERKIVSSKKKSYYHIIFLLRLSYYLFFCTFAAIL